MKQKTFSYFMVPFLFVCLSGAAQPSISLRVEPSHVSPNGDGIQDHVFFYPSLPSGSKVSRWRIDVVNAKGRRIQRLSGESLSALIKWLVIDKQNQTPPDGEYSLRLEAWTSRGRFRSETKSLSVDTVPPEISLRVSSATISQDNQGFVEFFPTVDDAASLDRWQLQILNQLGKTVMVEWSSGPIRNITWDAKDRATKVGLPPGHYTCVFQAWDKAGNASAPASLMIYNDLRQSQSLNQMIKRISIYETYIGLIVPLSIEDVFVKKKSMPLVSSKGDEFLKETAMLINAYPGASVRLDGYSAGMRVGGKNKDMSSLYAWAIYSHLVKKGNVKASRLSVRGRGKSPMFDRRAVQPPPVQNGVEILIEGSGPW